ncbi:MAG: DUF4919 domain-containing protein [Paramuribaculum sp.]|nr:DUF4919 domain-containing protein [Paramuribaculum sp.]
MKYIVAIVSLIIGICSVTAQVKFENVKREAPDLALIKKQINDRTSPYYYPRLMDEYQRNDTLMKIDKFRHLYLGYMFQEDYNPYRPSVIESNIDQQSLDKGELSRQECDSVISQAQLELQNKPFDLVQMSNLIKALKLKGKTNLAKIWQYKLDYILMAIVSTGTGADEENAWYVIEPQHEYMLLNAMGYIVTNHIFYEPYYEFLVVGTPQKPKTGGFYFNIHTVLQEYYRKYPEEL